MDEHEVKENESGPWLSPARRCCKYGFSEWLLDSTVSTLPRWISLDVSTTPLITLHKDHKLCQGASIHGTQMRRRNGLNASPTVAPASQLSIAEVTNRPSTSGLRNGHSRTARWNQPMAAALTIPCCEQVESHFLKDGYSQLKISYGVLVT